MYTASLGCVRKPEYLKRTRTDTETTCKLSQNQHPQPPCCEVRVRPAAPPCCPWCISQKCICLFVRWRRRPVATGHWRHLDLSPGGSSTVLGWLEGCWRSQRSRATDLLPPPFPPPRCPFVPLPPNRPAVPSRLPSNGWAAAYMRRTPLGSIHLHLNPSDAKSKDGLGEEGSAFTSDATHSEPAQVPCINRTNLISGDQGTQTIEAAWGMDSFQCIPL